MKYKVINSFSYDGKDYEPGDVIELADEKEAKPLIGNGDISDKKEKEATVKPKIHQDSEELQKLAEGEEECNEGVELEAKPKAKPKPKEEKPKEVSKTKAQLQEELDKLKVEYPKKATNKELEKLLKKAEK